MPTMSLSDDETDHSESKCGRDNFALTWRIIEDEHIEDDESLKNDIENNSKDPDFDSFIENYNVMHNKFLTLIDINKGMTAQITTASRDKEELATLNTFLKEENLWLQQIIEDKDFELQRLQKIYKMMFRDEMMKKLQ